MSLDRGRPSRRQFLIGAAVLSASGAVAATTVFDSLRAAAAPATGLSFTDDFQRPDSTTVGNGWNPLRGGWSIVGDSLETTGGTTEMEIVQTAFPLGRSFGIEARLGVGGASSDNNGIAFNVLDAGSGTQNLYVLSLTLNSPPTWWLWELAESNRSRLYGSGSAGLENVVPDHTYTVRVSAGVYGWFDVAILDGSTTLVSESVQIDPLAQQLAGGYGGVFSEGNNGGTFQVFMESLASSRAASDPPAPPAPEALVCTPVSGPPYTLPGTSWTIVSSSLVDNTNARLAVAQSLLTYKGNQYVAYYDGNLEMTVAQRAVTSDSWVGQQLDEYIGWDAHNSVGMAFDRSGQLHVAGDMHNVPLIYFRTSTPGDVTSLTKIASMVDPSTEQSETYPVFLYNGEGALIYNYRDGSSGDGSTYYNIYDETTQTWSRLFDQALFDGQGARNSYPSAPALGPDGNFHMVWVWRNTADAATNGHLCYARSADMVNWVTADGAPVTLPIVYTTPGVIVDPVPVYGGLLNGAPKIGFDANNRVVISYYKFDARWNTQVYFARHTPGRAWNIAQASDWTGRYWAYGIGGLPGVPTVSPVSMLPDGNLQMTYSYAGQSGIWIINAASLLPFTEVPVPQNTLPAEITTLRSTFPGMEVQVSDDHGSSGSPTERYVMRWEALPTNMDQPRNPPYPDPSQLQVYLLQEASS